MKKILAALALAAITALLVTGIAGSAGASAGIGVQLLDGSAPSPSWMQASIPQGGSKTWHVKIINSGTTTETTAATPRATRATSAAIPRCWP